MEEKTAVFSFGSLACEPEPRSYDVDEPTRELPLISGRFAGREWVAEDLRREYEQKKTAQRTRPARRNAVLAAAGCFAAAALLVGALMGQTRLTAMNDEAVAVSEEITVLQREQNALRIRYEQTLSSSRAERDAARCSCSRAPRRTPPTTPRKRPRCCISAGDGRCIITGNLLSTRLGHLFVEDRL
jgi:hypothetical protein